MIQVDVCFYNDKLYKLEDMSVLATITSVDHMALTEELKMIKKAYHIKVAIIGLDHLLRDVIYCEFPRCFVIIHPLDVVKMINYNLGLSMFIGDSQQEIAAGLEDEDLVMNELGLGCLGLYSNATKKEAIYHYRQWQGDVPLGIDCFYNVISTIDYYYEEVFNYFDFKNLFKEIMC